MNISKQNTQIHETTTKISQQMERGAMREEKLEKLLEDQKRGMQETNQLMQQMVSTNRENLDKLEELRVDSQSRLESFSSKVDDQNLHTDEIFRRLISSIDEHNEQTERRLRYL